MDRARPSIATTLVWAYWDLYQALRVLWRLSLVAFVILSGGFFATVIGPFLLTYNPIGQALARLIVLVALCFLLTPFLLAIHRFVLLGEIATRYEFKASNPRFRLYFGWLVVSVLLISMPSLLAALATPRAPIYYVDGHFGASAPSMILPTLPFAVFAVIQWISVLFAAASVEAPGATWQNAVHDVRPRLLFVFFATFIPIGALGLAALSLLRFLPRPFVSVPVTMASIMGALFLLYLILSAVIASRLYQVIGTRLNERLVPT